MVNSIPGIKEKIKALLSGDLYLVLFIVVIGLGSFGLGRLSASDTRTKAVILEVPSQASTSLQAAAAQAGVSGVSDSSGTVVASKNGSKYHFPWCASAKRIKDENKIWFASRKEAEKAGYTAAANCPGLE